ncbi:MAG: hypothetical protein ACLUGI_10915 [Subdoligranulum sp.]
MRPRGAGWCSGDDDNGYFADDVDAMPLQNAKIWHLTPTNQFRTKILLEREDPQSNYLIYAPFPKPPWSRNHLEDTILYSKQFHADPISLLCSDLGIGAEGKAVLQKYAKVVGEQTTQAKRFCDYKLSSVHGGCRGDSAALHRLQVPHRAV